MSNRHPSLYNKHRVCIICEGNEEYKYIDRLKELKVWNEQYEVSLVNAEGNGNIPARYQDRYQNGAYEAVLIFCDTDKKPYEQYDDIKRKINEFHGIDGIANEIIIFGNPCTMQIILKHWTDEMLTSQAKQVNAPIIEEHTKVKGYNPEVIFVPDYYNTIGLILTQSKDLGINAQFMGGDGWDGIQTNFGKVANGAIFASQFAPDDPDQHVQKFIAEYKKEYKADPIIFAALGYDTGTILETALKNVKDLSSKDEIKDAIKNFTGTNLVTGSLKYDSERNPEKKVTFIEVKDGKLTLKEKF